MKASKFSDAQKAFILKQGNDGVPVADVPRRVNSRTLRAGAVVGWQGSRKPDGAGR